MESWLVTGATGQLGSELLLLLGRDAQPKRICAVSRGRSTASPAADARSINLEDHAALEACVREVCPTHLVHVGAMTSVKDCFADPDRAAAVNTVATARLARAALDCCARFVFTSTDMVFDGDGAPYREHDPTAPRSVYGRTKVAAEHEVLAHDGTLVVRLPLMYGFPANNRETTFVKQVKALREHAPLDLFIDEFRTPIALRDAAAALIALARGGDAGVIHVAGPERLSRLQMVERFAIALGVSAVHANPISRLAAAAPEPRPADLSLDGRRFVERYSALVPRPVIAALLAR